MQVVEDLVARVPGRGEQTLLPDELAARCAGYVDRLLRERNGFVLECQDELLAAAGVPA